MILNPIEIVVPDVPFMRKRIGAITLWPFIFYRKGQKDLAKQLHEYHHWEEAMRWFVIPWYIAYVVLAIVYRTGGRNHPMERTAYEIEDSWRRKYD